MSTETIDEKYAQFDTNPKTHMGLWNYVCREFEKSGLLKEVRHRVVIDSENGVGYNVFWGDEDFTPRQTLDDYVSKSRNIAETHEFKLVRIGMEKNQYIITPFTPKDSLVLLGIGDTDIKTIDRANKFVHMIKREYDSLENMRKLLKK